MNYKIIDSNILLTSAESLQAFAPKPGSETSLVIPLGVLRELDKFKDESDYSGRPTSRAHKSREAFKAIDSLIKNDVLLSEGIQIGPNYQIVSSYSIETEMGRSLDDILESRNTDDWIIKIAHHLLKKNQSVEIITFDRSLRDIARALGIKAEPWQDYDQKHKVTEVFKGWRKIDCDQKHIDIFYQLGRLPVQNLGLEHLLPNEYVFADNGFAARYDASQKQLLPLYHYEHRYLKKTLTAQSVQQQFLADALRMWKA